MHNPDPEKSGQPRPQTINMPLLKRRLINALGRALEQQPPSSQNFYETAQLRLEQLYGQSGLHLEESLREQLFCEVMDEVAGYGPIQGLLNDPTINEIMVNGAKQVFIERGGLLLETGVTFENDGHVLRGLNRMVLPLGRRLD